MIAALLRWWHRIRCDLCRGRVNPSFFFLRAGSSPPSPFDGEDPLDLALAQIGRIAGGAIPAQPRPRALALMHWWLRVYTLARDRGDDELARVARGEYHYQRGRHDQVAGVSGPDISGAIATAISLTRARSPSPD